MNLPKMIAGILGLALSAAILWVSLSLPEFRVVGAGPAFYPRIIALVLALISVILITHSLREAVPPLENKIPVEVAAEQSRLPIVVVAIIGSFVYYLGLKPFGFIVMTVAYFSFLMFLIQSQKRVRRIILWSVGSTVFAYWVFAVLLRSSLPMGTVFH